ncbi:extracellular solute-binding protein [Desertihabitans aurantiacus]|uniref:extracellular solute-binding protein n=1 Tax=Desertihabitans aurantiacus TaxID=2282477 RepID=UPI000DF782F4|nr:extracellular solute-binding protein [Desertihabitans aurantiacus]
MTPSSRISRRRLLQTGLGAAAVSAVGVPTLSACSNEGRGGGGSQAQNDAVQLPDHIPYQGVPVDLEGPVGGNDGMLAYPADPVAATDGPPGDGQPVSALTMSNSPAPPSMDRNAFWQELNRRLGFELSVSLVPSADYQDRFQTAVAGGQLPDVFSVFPNETPSLPALLQAEAVDLTPFLSGSAIQAYPFLANVPTDSWRHTVYGGKIFGVPIPRGAALSSTLYGRDDLLAERGLAGAPDSWQAFYDLCAGASAGQANAWALGSVPLSTLRQMFGVPNTWADEGGRLVHAYEAERQQEALEAGRRLVADGLVHPDAFGVDQNQRKTWVVNGSTVFLEGTYSAWLSFYLLAAPDDIGLASYVPPRADGGGAAPIWLGNPTHNITSISVRSEDRVEALLDVLNYFASPFGTEEYLFKTYGLEGVHHDLEGTDPVLNDKGRSETALSLVYLGEPPFTLYQAGRPDVTQDQFDAMADTVPTGLANEALGLYSETQSRRGTQLSTAMADLENEILQGRQPVSAWADGVARWKADGGDAIRDELQRARDERAGR